MKKEEAKAIISNTLFMVAGHVIRNGARDDALEFLMHVDAAVDWGAVAWGEMVGLFRGYLGGEEGE